jgi:hypothetical protein
MTEKELQISKLANGVMMTLWQEDRSGKLLHLFIAKLCGLTRLQAFCIDDKYKSYIVTKEEYEQLKQGF